MCGPALHAAQGQQEAPETVELVQAASHAGCWCRCGVGVVWEWAQKEARETLTLLQSLPGDVCAELADALLE